MKFNFQTVKAFKVSGGCVDQVWAAKNWRERVRLTTYLVCLAWKMLREGGFILEMRFAERTNPRAAENPKTSGRVWAQGPSMIQ